MTDRAHLLSVDLRYRADPLPCYLHETEFGKRQDIVLGAVAFHQLLHVAVQLVAMLSGIHVDEIHDHDSSHVPEPQLSGNLFSCDLVYLEGVVLLIRCLGAYSAVDIDHIQSLCRLDDQIGSLLHRDHLSERTLDLSRDLEMVEDRFLSLVQLYDFLLLRRDQGDILLRLLKDVPVIDMDVAERIVEQIPEDCGCLAVLGEEQLGRFVPGNLLPRTFPFLDQRLGLGNQNGRFLAFCRCAYDGAVVLGKNALYQRFKPFLLLFGGNLLGNAYFFCKRKQYDVPSCQ